jgi:hypothetical protein
MVCARGPLGPPLFWMPGENLAIWQETSPQKVRDKPAQLFEGWFAVL